MLAGSIRDGEERRAVVMQAEASERGAICTAQRPSVAYAQPRQIGNTQRVLAILGSYAIKR